MSLDHEYPIPIFIYPCPIFKELGYNHSKILQSEGFIHENSEKLGSNKAVTRFYIKKYLYKDTYVHACIYLLVYIHIHIHTHIYIYIAYRYI